MAMYYKGLYIAQRDGRKDTGTSLMEVLRGLLMARFKCEQNEAFKLFVDPHEDGISERAELFRALQENGLLDGAYIGEAYKNLGRRRCEALYKKMHDKGLLYQSSAYTHHCKACGHVTMPVAEAVQNCPQCQQKTEATLLKGYYLRMSDVYPGLEEKLKLRSDELAWQNLESAFPAGDLCVTSSYPAGTEESVLHGKFYYAPWFQANMALIEGLFLQQQGKEIGDHHYTLYALTEDTRFNTPHLLALLLYLLEMGFPYSVKSEILDRPDSNSLAPVFKPLTREWISVSTMIQRTLLPLLFISHCQQEGKGSYIHSDSVGIKGLMSLIEVIRESLLILKRYGQNGIKRSKGRTPYDNTLIISSLSHTMQLDGHMKASDLCEATRELLAFIDGVQSYLTAVDQWTSKAEDEHQDVLEIIVYNLAEAMRILGVILQVFAPEMGSKLLSIFELKDPELVKWHSVMNFGVIANNTPMRMDVIDDLLLQLNHALNYDALYIQESVFLESVETSTDNRLSESPDPLIRQPEGALRPLAFDPWGDPILVASFAEGEFRDEEDISPADKEAISTMEMTADEGELPIEWQTFYTQRNSYKARLLEEDYTLPKLVIEQPDETLQAELQSLTEREEERRRNKQQLLNTLFALESDESLGEPEESGETGEPGEPEESGEAGETGEQGEPEALGELEILEELVEGTADSLALGPVEPDIACDDILSEMDLLQEEMPDPTVYEEEPQEQIPLQSQAVMEADIDMDLQPAQGDTPSDFHTEMPLTATVEMADEDKHFEERSPLSDDVDMTDARGDESLVEVVEELSSDEVMHSSETEYSPSDLNVSEVTDQVSEPLREVMPENEPAAADMEEKSSFEEASPLETEQLLTGEQETCLEEDLTEAIDSAGGFYSPVEAELLKLTLNSKNELIRILQKQLDVKDALIDNQSRQLENFQILLKKNQDQILLLEHQLSQGRGNNDEQTGGLWKRLLK